MEEIKQSIFGCNLSANENAAKYVSMSKPSMIIYVMIKMLKSIEELKTFLNVTSSTDV